MVEFTTNSLECLIEGVNAYQLPDETEPEWLLGDLPETPKHTFIGRSRDLLKLERLLDRQPYAVIRGMGGIGKTAVAVELARWLVQCRCFERCAFVSVETYTHERAIVDILGKQLVGEKYSVAEYGDNLDAALQHVMEVLQTQRTLLVIDNMESLLADVGNTEHVLALADRLIKLSHQNRLLFTSYEALPIPFEQQQCTINLGTLSSDDAKQLVTNVMNIKSQLLSFNFQNNALEEVRALANTVNCHARTLVSLANEIKITEVKNAGQDIRGTILKLERIHSSRKNKSFFSNVRKSIEKINHADIKFIKSLAIFHSHIDIKILQKILGVDDKKIRKIINEMIRTGLAEEIIEHDYLRFDPILPIYMDFSITSKQKELYQNRLINLMDEKIKYLYDLYQNNSLKYENLIKMEMPNLLMLLNTLSERLKSNQCHVNFFTRYLINIELLMRDIDGYQHKYDEIVKLCNQALEAYKVWGAVTFNLEKIKVDSLLYSGQIEESFNKANALIKKCEAAGKDAYSDAEYDIALAYATIGRVYDVYGKTRDALPYLEKAQEKFSAMGKKGLFMAFSLLGEQADCWKNEGNFSKAEEIYKKIFENEKYESIPKNLLSISKYLRAINNIKRKEFDIAINDLNSAVVFFKAAKDINKTHQSLAGLGHAYREMALKTKGEAIYYMRKSEDYYMQALATYDSAKNPKHEAETFTELGNLYNAWNRQEYAAKFYQMAANIFFRLNDLREEGIARSNLAHALIQVGHYNQAYEELKRSLVCKEPYNGSVEPWITWNLLSYLEKVKGNMLAAKDNYQKALSMFLSYRRIGGEHPSKIDTLCRFIFNELNQEDTSKAVEFINNLSMQNDWQEYQNFLEKLQAILAGERSLALVEDEDLRYDLAAELILLLEELQEAGI